MARAAQEVPPVGRDSTANSEGLEDSRKRLQQLREFMQFMTDYSNGRTDFDLLENEEPDKAKLFRKIRDTFTALQAEDPKYAQSSVMNVVEEFVQRLEMRVQRLEKKGAAQTTESTAETVVPQAGAEAKVTQYRDSARRVQTLIDFFRADGNWEQVDQTNPTLGQELRNTYASLERASQQDPAYKDKSLGLAQVAEALVQRFTGKAAALEAAQPKPMPVLPTARSEKKVRVETPRAKLEVAELSMPSETNQPWQILRVNRTNRTYIIGRMSDRRSPGDIIADVMGENQYQGMPAGYEIPWEDFEEYAEAVAQMKGGRLRASGE